MTFVHIDTFINYIDANIILGRLDEEGIRGWLRDENTATINPVWAAAIGGIKLMVPEQQAERALQLLQQFREEKKENIKCVKCGSSNVELVSSPRKARNWLGAFAGFLFGDYAIAPDKVYHCFDCGHEEAL